MTFSRGKAGWWVVGALLAVGVALAGRTALGTEPAAQGPVKRPSIYDGSTDARTQIAEALQRARRDHRRVLMMFGADWCGWCHKLHAAFKENKDVAKALYEYEVVLVDVGRRDKHMDVATSYNVDLSKEGIPYLTVLDADGKVLANQETGSLESGERHDPEKLLSFLKRFAPPPQDARQVLDAALSQAKAQGKVLFLHLGAPWCGWCRKLDAFFARPEIAELMARDYIDVHIDLDRMTSATEVASRFRKNENSGLPWFAFVSAEGQVLATSEGPGGNVGFPAAPEEIAHFNSVLKSTAKRLTAEQIGRIEQALKDAGRGHGS